MRSIVRRFHSPDLCDLERDVPADPRNCSVLVQVMVGPSDGFGEESFDVVVCTPLWLAAEVERWGVVPLHAHVVVDQWQWSAVRDTLTRMFGQATGDDWESIAVRLSRWGRWEFE